MHAHMPEMCIIIPSNLAESSKQTSRHVCAGFCSWLGTVGTWLWALARGLVAVAALAALTAAALPAVVSTPAGLRAVLSIANVASPGVRSLPFSWIISL